MGQHAEWLSEKKDIRKEGVLVHVTCASLQLLLVALLLLVVPQRSGKDFVKSLTPDTFSQAAVDMDTIPAGQGSEKYCIIFDAGSTGESHQGPYQCSKLLLIICLLFASAIYAPSMAHWHQYQVACRQDF